jgi:hypothetical protein
MQAHDRLGIPSHALLSRALFPPAPPGFLFWILASQFCQTVGDNLFFLLLILIWELANSIFCQTKNAKPLELLLWDSYCKRNMEKEAGKKSMAQSVRVLVQIYFLLFWHGLFHFCYYKRVQN